MDIVVPFQRSVNRDEELKFALRSIEKHLTGIGNVFVVGDNPRWNHSIIHVPQVNISKNNSYRDRNIAAKILTACEMAQVSDNFLILHDDNFLLQGCPASMWPYYHCGPSFKGNGDYRQVEMNTQYMFGDCKNFDVHAPHIVNKNLFKKTIGTLDWSLKYGYCIKTAYCTMNGIEGEFEPDLKINGDWEYEWIKNRIVGRKWFSIGDNAWRGGMVKLMKELYPEKSKWEK